MTALPLQNEKSLLYLIETNVNTTKQKTNDLKTTVKGLKKLVQKRIENCTWDCRI